MFELATARGLSADEVVALDLADVSTLTTSDGALEQYLARARPTLAVDAAEPALFLSKNGRRLSPSDVRRRVLRAPVQSAQIESKRLRRAYAQAHPRA
jgi:site-specific recombinase XerD